MQKDERRGEKKGKAVRHQQLQDEKCNSFFCCIHPLGPVAAAAPMLISNQKTVVQPVPVIVSYYFRQMEHSNILSFFS